jgi:hypothetical protein
MRYFGRILTVYEVRRTFDVVRRVKTSVVTRHFDRGHRVIVLRMGDSGPVNITQPAKCPASVTVDIVAQSTTPVARRAYVMRLFSPTGI